MTTTTQTKCACAKHQDGSITTFLCPIHATEDPCTTKASVTGRRRRGSVRGKQCSHCGWTVTE